LPSNVLLVQLTGDWWNSNVATVTKRRKILNVEGKYKVTRGIENGEKRSWRVLEICSRKFYSPKDL
jgi:hypothetical protein